MPLDVFSVHRHDIIAAWGSVFSKIDSRREVAAYPPRGAYCSRLVLEDITVVYIPKEVAVSAEYVDVLIGLQQGIQILCRLICLLYHSLCSVFWVFVVGCMHCYKQRRVLWNVCQVFLEPLELLVIYSS